MSDLTEWVILAYLDGNNELEPETAAAMNEMKNALFSKDHILLLQIGRLNQDTVKILRPKELLDHPEDTWSGVRRYSISKSGTVLLKELGNLNMADPSRLFEFILWGMQKFKAAHYMLILSGHACEYIGMLNDYSQRKPYLMGIPELSLVLEYIKRTLGQSIDALLLDTCLFNNIEVLYELAQCSSAVNTVLVHHDNAPVGGLSYQELFEAMSECQPQDTETLLLKLIQYSSADLVAYRIDSPRLERIKKLFGSLGYKILEQKGLDLLPELRRNDSKLPEQEIRDEITRWISSLIIGQKSVFRQPFETIYALDKYIPDKSTAEMYYRLAFARDNPWTGLLCSRLPEKQFQFAVSVGFSPLALERNKVNALILSSNSAMAEKEADNILNALIADRGWEI